MSLDVPVVHRPPHGPIDLSEARAIARSTIDDGMLPSVVFGVSDANGVVGTAALSGPDTKVEVDSIFFLASVTKPIVATAFMRYIDEGRLDLHAPIARYLPEFEGPERETITPWHVLTHSSGLPDMPVQELFSRRPGYAAALADAIESNPTFEPGSRVRYASAPWLLLAEIMARASSTTFDRVLEMRVSGPLHMRDTTFDPRYDRARVVSLKGIEVDNRLVEKVMLRFLARAMLPGGGMFGTIADLLKLGCALLPSRPDTDCRTERPDQARVLSATAVTRMGTLQTADLEEDLPDGEVQPARFALGWTKPVDTLPGTPSALTHGGAAGGRLWVDPDAGLAFAFLTNRWAAPKAPAYAVLEAIYRARG